MMKPGLLFVFGVVLMILALVCEFVPIGDVHLEEQRKFTRGGFAFGGALIALGFAKRILRR
jgi:hypothetical protein